MSFTGEDPTKELQGATNCPHCNGVAKAVPHDEYRWVCNLCGAPRIEVKRPGVVLSGDELPYLQRAKSAKGARAGWRFAGFFGGITGAFGLFATLILQLLISPDSILWAGTGVAMSLPFLILALAAFAKDNARTKQIDKEIDEAWRIAGRDVVMQSKSITAEQLTDILPMNQKDADQLAAELSIDENLHSRVNEDGRLQLTPLSKTKVRIDPGADAAGPTMATGDPLEERFAALEEAVAAEQAEKNKTMKM